MAEMRVVWVKGGIAVAVEHVSAEADGVAAPNALTALVLLH
ncbi:MAG: hypothetical protein ACRDPA_10420 [Solirubrobacteraceae bacterium]